MTGNFRTLWRIMAGQRLRYGGAIAAIGVATILAYGVPLVGRATIDDAIRKFAPSPLPPRERSARSAEPGEGEASNQGATSVVAGASDSSEPSPSPQPSPSEGEGADPTSPSRERSARSAEPGEGEASNEGATSVVAGASDSSEPSPSPQPSPSEGEGVGSFNVPGLLGGADHLAHNLWLAALAMFVLTAAAGFFTFFKVRWSAGASEEIARNLRNNLYDHLQRLPAKYLDKADTGDLVQRCTSDVETMRLFLSAQVVEIGNALILLCTAVPIMLWLDARMTLVSLSLVPLIIGFAVVFFIKVKHRFKAVEQAESEMTTVLQENLTGIRVVRAFARQEFERSKFAAKNDLFRDRSFTLVRLMAVYWTASDLLVLCQMCFALGFGAYWITQGETTVGTLYAFLAILQMMLWPVRQMGRILTDLGKATVAMGRVREILNEAEEAAKEDRASAKPQALCAGRIDVVNLTFSHAGSPQPVLTDINLHVEPGQTLAILGPSGAGKSTLMHLLLRLYDYEQGEIRIDGHEIRSLPRQSVRSQIGVVMQEPFLFSKSLGENIRHGKGEAMSHEVEAAAEVAHIHETITGFEQGYETVIGERGVNLSGGQRQRVAIARAFVRDPAILILDDALSAVDSRTETFILAALRQRRGRRTTIVIAHRLSTLMQADHIIVLDKGRIVQRGTHEELKVQEGMYRKLWTIQSSVEEELEREISTTQQAR